MKQLLPVMLLLAACSSPVPLHTDYFRATFTVDTEFTNKEYSWIQESADSWAVATDGEVQLSFVRGPVQFANGVRHTIAKVGYLPDDPTVLGRCSGRYSDVIAIGVQLELEPSYEPAFRVTAAHELGHFLGLGHADSDTCVMFPFAYNVAAQGITAATQCDSDAFQAKWHAN